MSQKEQDNNRQQSAFTDAELGICIDAYCDEYLLSPFRRVKWA